MPDPMRKRNRFLLWSSCFFLSLSCLAAQLDSLLSSLVITEDLEQEKTLLSARRATETYYNLGCKHQGWVGYFLPQRWHKSVNFGGVEEKELEAPRAEIAESDAPNRLDIETNNSTLYAWRITVPADGYIYFRLEKEGDFFSPRISSSELKLQILHNEEVLAFNQLEDGSYYSPFLRAGDVFGLVFLEQATTYHWSELTFYSNSVGVLVSPSEKEEDWKADTVRAISKAAIDQLFFPDDKPETWPLIDIDGDLFTQEDQIETLPNDPASPLMLVYRDQIKLREGQYWVSREFTVTEPCGGNSLQITRWWHPLPILPPSQTRDTVRTQK